MNNFAAGQKYFTAQILSFKSGKSNLTWFFFNTQMGSSWCRWKSPLPVSQYHRSNFDFSNDFSQSKQNILRHVIFIIGVNSVLNKQVKVKKQMPTNVISSRGNDLPNKLWKKLLWPTTRQHRLSAWSKCDIHLQSHTHTQMHTLRWHYCTRQ